MKCPFLIQLPPVAVRKDLPPLTPRIAALPVDERGYPIPFFVSYVNGKPEFRAADARKWRACVKLGLCWVCGQPLGKFKTFTIGPMCSITRTTAEPPEHLDCDEWSVKGCPFLSKPAMVRREGGQDFAKTKELRDITAGIPIDRNPGVSCVWTTLSYEIFPDGKGGRLIQVGEPESVEWWREGRIATRAEVMESITTGLPKLLEQCPDERSHAALRQDVNRAMKLLPPL